MSDATKIDRDAIRKALIENLFAAPYDSILGLGAGVMGIDEAVDAVIAHLNLQATTPPVDADTLDRFEGYVTNMSETPEVSQHVYQMLAGFKEEQGVAVPVEPAVEWEEVPHE